MSRFRTGTRSPILWLAALAVLGLAMGLVVSWAPLLYSAAGLVGLGYLFLCARQPALGLALAAFVVPVFGNYTLLSGQAVIDITLSRAAAVCVVLGCLIGGRVKGENRGHLAPEILMAAYCAVVVGTTFLRYPPLEAVRKGLYFGDCFVIPFVYYALAKRLLVDRKHAKWALRCALGAGLYLTVLGAYQFFAHADLLISEETGGIQLSSAAGADYTRSTGPFPQTSTYSILLGVFVFAGRYMVGSALRHRGRDYLRGTLLWGAVLAEFAALCFALMRMTIVAVAGGIGARLLFFRKEIRVYVFAGFALLVVSLLGWDTLRSSTLYRDRIANLETGFVRLATWKEAVRMVPSYAGLGAGFLGYPDAQEKMRERIDYRGYPPRPTVHNSFLKLLIETGALGVTLYCVTIALFFRYVLEFGLRHAEKEAREFAAMQMGVICMYVIPGLTLGSFVDPPVNGVFFTCMGMLAGRVGQDRAVDLSA